MSFSSALFEQNPDDSLVRLGFDAAGHGFDQLQAANQQ
jgi:hypothetical protein